MFTSDVGVEQYPVSIGFVIAGGLFLIAVICDFLDGYLARKWKVISVFGQLWDPLADKILINALLITLAATGYLHWALVLVFIIRDMLVDGLRMQAATKNIVIPADLAGKLKTAVQMTAIICTFFVFSMPWQTALKSLANTLWYFAGQMLLYYLAAICAVVSGVLYYYKITRVLRPRASLAQVRVDVKPTNAPGEEQPRPS